MPLPDATESTSSTELAELPRPPRSIAELQWLLAIIIAFYLVAPGAPVDDSRWMAAVLALYLLFVLLLRGLGRRRQDIGWKLLAQIWAMIAVITAVSWQSGRHDSALLNLYLLPLIASAIGLQRWGNAAHVGLIVACYALLAAVGGAEILSLAWGSRLLAEVAPLVVVASILGRLAGDMRIARSRIHVLSETDELTGLFNMRAFNRLHRREHEHAERHSRPYCLMMLDLDNLKQINDTHGHEAGNQAIKAIARAVARITRVTDAVARYGGDEFVVLLHEADRHMVAEVAERIRKTFVATRIEFDGAPICATASIGYACYPGDGSEPAELLALADRRMYADKRRQRLDGAS